MWCEEVFSPLFQSWPSKRNASSCIYWYIWCLNTLSHSISTEEDVQLLFTIAAALQALSRLAFSRLLFPSVQVWPFILLNYLSVLKCGMLLCTLSTKWYRSFAIKVRLAFLISIPPVFVLHRDIKASSKWAHYRLVLLNKPMLPAISRLHQFPSATYQLWSAYRFSASSMTGEERIWIEKCNLSAICQS